MSDLPAGTPIEQVAEHHCFGCGRLNAHGLQLAFRAHEAGGVQAAFVPAPRFQGYDGMVHGGVISTVLDEVMAWSLYRERIWAVTGELTVRYRVPVAIGEPTTAVGWMTARRNRRIEMTGEIRRDADGTVLARATAVFVVVPSAQAEAWNQRYMADRAAAEAAARLSVTVQADAPDLMPRSGGTT